MLKQDLKEMKGARSVFLKCVKKLKNPGAIKRLKLEISRAALNFTGEKIPNRKKMLFELKNVSKNLGEKALCRFFKSYFTR